jgi:ADP-ribose pyrophosphatase
MDDPALTDRPVEARLGDPERLGTGRHHYQRYRVDLPASRAGTVSRDVVRVGRVVVILPVDPDRGEIVMLRQFRLGAHLATGRGELVEVPAGHVEAGEDWLDAARRECVEEIGVAPARLVPLFDVLPSPGMSDELQRFFVGAVDASRVPRRAGAEGEHEETRPLRVPIERALAALSAGSLSYAASVLALQWLALNRDRLEQILRHGATRRDGAAP